MAADDSKRAIGSPTGGTGGTGQPDTSPETPAASVAERDRESGSLAGGDGSTNVAIGEGGAGGVSGTGGAAAQSGRRSGEGAGASLPNPPDPGDPGGMGGVATNRTGGHDRPPGGVSPIEPDED